MTRVLHIDTAMEWRGGQRQLALLLAGRPDDLWAGVPGSPLAERLGPPSVVLRPGANPLNILALRSVAGSVDLVAAHTPHALGIALLAGLSTVAHRRVDFVPSGLKYRRAAHVIAVSAAVRDVMLSVGVQAERVTVVHDGVTPTLGAADSRWAGYPRPLYGCVGALVAHKGHRHVIDAMGGVPGTLVIAGEGPLRSALAEQVQRLGLQARVVLARQVDVTGLYPALDVFVHPSEEEGMGQAVVEAMAAGCRIVATRAGGLPEVVGDAGEVVAPKDPVALGAAMVRALAGPKGQGVERSRLYSVEAMVAGTGAVYDRVNAELRQRRR